MNKKNNVIGVIGGLGNEAMVDLVSKIQNIPGHDDHSYVFFGNSRLAYKPEEVGQQWLFTDEPELRRAQTAIHTSNIMRHLGCSVIGLACNSAHDLFRGIMADIPVHFIDMLRETARTMDGVQGHVLIMGVTHLVDSGLYQKALNDRSIKAIKPSPENQERIMAAIYNPTFGIKTAKITRQAESLLCNVIREEFEQQGCRHVVLGCTELPLVLTQENCARFKREGMIQESVKVIDASSVLAEALVRADSRPPAYGPHPDDFMTGHTDWFPPATFQVGSLDELVTIQEKIFEQTVTYLAKRGRALTGSYMHLPTLFIVGNVSNIGHRLASLGLDVMDGQAPLGQVLPHMFAAHFERAPE